MGKRIKSAYLLVIFLFFFILIFPQPFFLDSQAAEGTASPQEQSEAVFTAVTHSFALFSSLLNDVAYAQDSIYPIVLKADSYDTAIKYLDQGFENELATSMAHYYLGWDEELAKIVVIPTDCIPIITSADRENVNIVFINEKTAVLQRKYDRCYAENDSYMYTVKVQKEASGWKISDLSLEEVKSGNSDEKP